MEDKEFEKKFNNDKEIQKLTYYMNKSYEECLNLSELETTKMIIENSIDLNIKRVEILYLINNHNLDNKTFILKVANKLKLLSNEKYNQCVLKFNIN